MDSLNLTTKVCKLFYKDGLGKTEIEKRLHISRFKVARMLNNALKSGLVEITIKEPSPDLGEFEERLEKATGLNNVILVEDNGESLEQLKEKSGKAAAAYLLEIISNGDVLGIGWGTTTCELVRSLPDSLGKSMTVVQVSGGLSKLDSGIDSQALTIQLARKFGTTPNLLHAPAVVDRPETRDMLMKESSLKNVFKLHKSVKFLMAGIGALIPDGGFVGSWSCDPKEIDELNRQGAVAELLSYCFDLNGKYCPSSSHGRKIAIPLEDIMRVPCSIGIAVGEQKAQAILGIVRSRCINTLITDTTTAKALWQTMMNSNAPKGLETVD